MASSDEERRRYAEKIARDWAERGKLVEGGWRAFRQTTLRTMNFDDPATREDLLRSLYFLACDHLFFSMVGPLLDPGHEETAGDLRRFELIRRELTDWRVTYLAPHKPGRA